MSETRKPKPKTIGEQPAQLLTVAQVAQLDGTSEKTVRRAIDAGDLKVVRIGPARLLIRIHPDDHAAYRRGSFGA